jgi:hypothetical protein
MLVRGGWDEEGTCGSGVNRRLWIGLCFGMAAKEYEIPMFSHGHVLYGTIFSAGKNLYTAQHANHQELEAKQK